MAEQNGICAVFTGQEITAIHIEKEGLKKTGVRIGLWHRNEGGIHYGSED